MNGLDWRERAKASALPCFPIRVFHDATTGRWVKRPLTRSGHKDASYDIDSFGALWDRANGLGLPMGRFASAVGWYALDVDRHKGDGVEAAAMAWFAKYNVPVQTRRHKTVSGGEHFIYALPGRFSDLPSRSNIVRGMDARGSGGWIAFGEGYEILDDRAPVLLPIAASEAILAGYTGAGGGRAADLGTVEIGTYRPPDAARRAEIEAKLQSRIEIDRERFLGWDRPPRLVERWEHGRKEDGDTSVSAMDHSLAKLLALRGFTAEEIVIVLAEMFPHGIARRDGLTPRTLRALGRCAAKAVLTTDAEKMERMVAPPQNYTRDDIDAAAAALFGASMAK